jgi:CheY-like chemotaxis protein
VFIVSALRECREEGKRLFMKNQQRTFNILFLDDELAEFYLLKVAMKAVPLPIKLYHFSDGVEGLDFLLNIDKHPEHSIPDLILLDINMPRINGHDFLAIIKSDEWLKNIPVIVLSSSSLESDILYSYELGASEYVTKSTEHANYCQSIKQVCEHWLTVHCI